MQADEFHLVTDGPRIRLNSEKAMAYHQHSLSISEAEAEAVAVNGLPLCNQKENPGSGKILESSGGFWIGFFYKSPLDGKVTKCIHVIHGTLFSPQFLSNETIGLELL